MREKASVWQDGEGNGLHILIFALDAEKACTCPVGPPEGPLLWRVPIPSSERPHPLWSSHKNYALPNGFRFGDLSPKFPTNLDGVTNQKVGKCSKIVAKWSWKWGSHSLEVAMIFSAWVNQQLFIFQFTSDEGILSGVSIVGLGEMLEDAATAPAKKWCLFSWWPK